ncbi:F0F1 ATP synthase subunit delta [Stakelama tenebrarum]|uniref:F0F1 ATP synthase subunit delta n=1 Tax=Stakelama tenebrarum TaxID=2711215 RepID=UPI00389A676C
METSGGNIGSDNIASSIRASLSGRYATALFELAVEGNQIEAVGTSLGTLRAAIDESDEFRRLIESPLVSRGEAAAAMAAVAEKLGIDPVTSRFMGVLAENRRLSQLPAIIRDFRSLAAAHRGEATAEVASAHPLTDDQIAALKDQLAARVGKKISLDLSVDPALLGGLRVKIGSQMIDSTIRTRLNSLAHAMKG